MMNRKLRFLILVCALIAANLFSPPEGCAQSQAANTRCRDLAQKYTSAISYHIQMNVKMFSQIEDAEPIQSFLATSVKVGNLFYRDAFNQVAVLTKEGVALLIDKSNSVIQMEKPGNVPVESPVSELTEEEMNYYLVSSKDGTTIIETGKIPFVGIEKIRVTIDNNRELISKVEYFYQNSEEIVFRKVVVDFVSTIINEKTDNSFFELKKYVKKIHGEYTGVGPYVGYNIVKRF